MWCPAPITIDKTASWGAGNFQEGPNGAFLKINSDFYTVSHLVQPNADKTAPLGWVPTEEAVTKDMKGLFDKMDVWVVTNEDDSFLVLNDQIFTLKIADSKKPFNYEITEPSVIVCNDINGEPNMDDAWIIKLADFEKNYEY